MHNGATRFVRVCVGTVAATSLALIALLVVARIAVRFTRWRAGTPGRRKVAFFHPYCNAGGGGERVLWCAIRALQNMDATADVFVYTGDAATGEAILAKAESRFGFAVPRSVTFVFLKHRWAVEAVTYPRLTMLGQSLGSLLLGAEALARLAPDAYFDTMGYAFTMPIFRFIGAARVGCYTHYPTISTNMIERVEARREDYNNVGAISRSPLLSLLKVHVYYRPFAWAYGIAGRCADVVAVNSTWTQGHIAHMWGPRCGKTGPTVIFPPCAVEHFVRDRPIAGRPAMAWRGSAEAAAAVPARRHLIVSVAQFRPEKCHALQIRAFARLLREAAAGSPSAAGSDGGVANAALVLIGSCRTELSFGDVARLDALRALAAELGVVERVHFEVNVSFDRLCATCARSTIGLHSMRDEHFGISVVELMAAGTVTIAHDSAGPKLDIVTPFEGGDTGFLESTEEGFAGAMAKAFAMSSAERLVMQERARRSVRARFSEAIFDDAIRVFLNDLLSSAST